MPDDVFDADTFPETLYLAAFGDVRQAVAAGQFESGYVHYVAFGKAEIERGTRTSPFTGGPPGLANSILPPPPASGPIPAAPVAQNLAASPRAIPYLPPPPPIVAQIGQPFAEDLYLALNPDVAGLVAGGIYASGHAHFRAAGQAEEQAGLRPSLTDDALYADMPPAGTDNPVDTDRFDAESYFTLYPDVLKAFGKDPAAARHHWVHHGRFEGRVASGIAPYRTWQARPAEMLKKPFGINVFGPFAATSGLGTAARGLLRAVQSTGIATELHPFDVSRAVARITPEERAAKPTYRCNLFLANADQVGHLLSLYPSGHFDDTYNIAVWAWELAAFRADWYPSFAPLDEVWTNSEFEMQSIGAIAPVPLTKIRLPVEVESASAEEGRDMFGIPHDRLVFLVAFDVGSTSARKNPGMVIEAFREAFAADENVFLVIKFHSTSMEPAITRQITRALRGAENVLVIADVLSEPDMALLRAACDCFVSAHRSEGFGLNLAEFMALGKAVIATAYSGNLEFFDETVGYPLAYDLTEVTAQSGPYMPFYVWANPSKTALIEQLRAVYEDQQAAWARGKRAAERIRNEFSAVRIGQEIRRRLHVIGLASDRPACLAWFGSARGLVGQAPLASLTLAQRQAIHALGVAPPVLSLIVPVYNVQAAFLQQCVMSVLSQSYPFWELCLCDDASTDPATLDVLNRLQGRDPRIRIRRAKRNSGISGASNLAAEMATGPYIAMLDNDDTLHADALLEIARALVKDPGIDVIYTDEDKIDAQGRVIDTYHKPDWSPEHLESVMYVLHMMVVRKRLFLELGGFREAYGGAQDYDLMLRLARRTQKIHHIPRALYHWRAVEGSAAATVDAKPWALKAGFRALSDHLSAKHGDAAWVEEGLLPGTFRARRKILGMPRVSLLILTNNAELDMPGRGRFHMVDNLVESILRRTAYRNYEIVVVDNSKLSAEQIARFRALGVRVENYTGTVVPFNYAAKANYAVRVCRTEHLVFLNDDMEVADESWLGNLLELSQDPEIGAVGARLLHADGTIQHVGCVLGVNGGAVHVYHSFPGDHVGYNGFTHVIRNYSAVTAACIATRKSVLAQVGGFDEKLAIDFNDIDLCLKIVENGYRIVYTPYCTLFHFEGASAKRVSQNVEERKRFIARWSRYMENDPYFNPNFSRNRFDFTVASLLVDAAKRSATAT
jgi:GT2 family glycosyltransferase/glycosyltransferase involved in cell wall biosynthesis